MADEMRAYDPTMRERMASALQGGMEGMGVNRYKARKHAQTVMGGESSNLPLGVGVADFVPFVGTTMGVEEGARDLGHAAEAVKRGDYIDAAADTAGAAMGLIPGGYSTYKTGKNMLKKLKTIDLPKLKLIETDSVPKKSQSLKEWAMAGGGVPESHKDRADVWHKKAHKYASGGEVFNTVPDMADGGDIIQGPAYAKGGAVNMAKGGKVKGIVKEGLEKLFGKADKAPKGVEPIVVRTPEERAAIEKFYSGAKMSKAENIAAGLYHPVGEGKKLSRPFSQMTAETIDNPNVVMKQGSIITPEQAVKDRLGFFPLIGDRAATGKILTKVNDVPLRNPTPLTGGGRYGQANYDPEMALSGGWESGKGKVGALRNRIASIAESGYEPVGIFSPGSHAQVDFNTMMPHALLNQFDPTNTTKRLIKQFDKEVKQIYPDFVGIANPDVEAQLMDKSNGVLRTAFNKVMNKDDYQSGGFPDVAATRKAISEPELHDIEKGTVGMTMAKFDPQGRLVEVPKHPSSYPLSMQAQHMGELDNPENYADFFSSQTGARRLLGADPQADYRSFEMVQPIQYADQEWLDNLMKKRELRDKLIQGKKKGGSVTKPTKLKKADKIKSRLSALEKA